ncbi:MAG: DUF4917 family protein [Myxococcota bacterium]
MTLLEYAEVRRQIQAEPATLLLGNGFSIPACGRFQYGSLYEEAKQSLDRDIALFKSLDTNDFERALRALDDAGHVAAHIGVELDCTDVRDRVKDALIETVQKVHPAYGEIELGWWAKAADLTQGFDRIFTTNYDLLLYWLMLQRGQDHFTDGFQRVDSDLVFTEHFPEGRTQVLFLHGALHLRQTPNGAVKAVASGNRSLPNVLDELMTSGIRPLFVSEGESRHKRSAIERNPYLAFASKQLRRGRGDLVTFGLSFSESDDHLLDAIAAAPSYKRIFVGIHAPASNTIMRVSGKLENWKNEVPDRKVEFYSTQGLL